MLTESPPPTWECPIKGHRYPPESRMACVECGEVAREGRRVVYGKVEMPQDDIMKVEPWW